MVIWLSQENYKCEEHASSVKVRFANCMRSLPSMFSYSELQHYIAHTNHRIVCMNYTHTGLYSLTIFLHIQYCD